MIPTVHAILYRFDGDYNAALEYCEATAYQYAHLRTEYRHAREMLLEAQKTKQGGKHELQR
jgi:hypothetical protein